MQCGLRLARQDIKKELRTANKDLQWVLCIVPAESSDDSGVIAAPAHEQRVASRAEVTPPASAAASPLAASAESALSANDGAVGSDESAARDSSPAVALQRVPAAN